MNFSKYMKENWDGDKFCHELAESAKIAVYKIFIEMAMGVKAIHDPKYPILHDADDYKFLIQFPPKIWSQALNWRYNEGIRNIMRERDVEKYGKTHIPEGWDYTNKFVLPIGGTKYIFGSDNGEKNIYLGLTQLIKKLTLPSKGIPQDMTYDPEKPGQPHPHWPGEGPSLAEIDPNQTDPNHPQHSSNYKHGLYDFDLDDLAEVSDKHIEDIEDEDIQAWLGSFPPENPLDKRNIDDPEVQATIKKIRKQMLDVKKHTMATYDVPQLATTRKDLSDWITANALNLYGEHPKSGYHDPHVKDKLHGITYKSPEQLNSEKGGLGFISRKNKKEGGFSLRHDIPTIKRHLTYQVWDKDSDKPKNVDEDFTMPYLNPQKTIPQLRDTSEDLTDEELRNHALSKMPHKEGVWNWQPGESYANVQERLKDQPDELESLKVATQTNRLSITDDQKRQIAMIRNPDKVKNDWNWQPGESYETVFGRLKGQETAKGKKTTELATAVKVDTLKNFMKFWNIWTPEQQKFIHDNTRSIHGMARHVFGKTPGTNDILASPNLIYAAGPRVNYKSPASGVLNVPPDKMSEFVKTYIPKLELELETGVPIRGPKDTPLSQNELDDIAKKFKGDSSDKSKGTGGKMGKLLDQMERSGGGADYAPQVIDALRTRIDSLTKFAAYILLTFLNDRRYGIKDERFNLLTTPLNDENGQPMKEHPIDLQANENMRTQKIQLFLRSAAQIGFDDVIESRKMREKFGIGPTVQSISALQASGHEISQDQLDKMKESGGKISRAAKRRWLKSSQHSVARAGQKLHSATAALPEFLELRRNQILNSLKKSPQAVVDLEAAEKEIANGVEVAIVIFNKYDKELQSQIPDEDERENEVMKRVQGELAKNPNLNVSDVNMEAILNRTRTRAGAGKGPNPEKIVGPMNAWVEAFLNLDKNKSIKLQTYDENEHKIVPTHEEVTPALMPVQPYKILNLIYELYQYPKLVLDATHKYGFKMYEKVYNSHDYSSLTPQKKAMYDADMKEEWDEEVAKWEKSLMNYAVPAPTATTATTAPTPMPQQAAQPQQAAAKALGPLDNLFTMVPKVNNSADLLKIGHDLLAQRAEMMAQPGSGQKLHQAVTTLKNNREFFAKGLPPKEEYTMFKQLAELVWELEAKHNG